MARTFTKYLEDIEDTSKILNATNWFRSKANETSEINTGNLIREARSDAVSRVRLGHFYLFKYDPKLKETLNYYDTFPVTLVIRKLNDGFIGLNFHYLPYVYRVKLMDSLYEYAIEDKLDSKKIAVTYRMLHTASKLRFFRPCIKRYLNSHIRSRYIHVTPAEWDIAVFLPLQKFKKAMTNTVYKDSVAMLRRGQVKGNMVK